MKLLSPGRNLMLRSRGKPKGTLTIGGPCDGEGWPLDILGGDTLTISPIGAHYHGTGRTLQYQRSHVGLKRYGPVYWEALYLDPDELAVTAEAGAQKGDPLEETLAPVGRYIYAGTSQYGESSKMGPVPVPTSTLQFPTRSVRRGLGTQAFQIGEPSFATSSAFALDSMVGMC